MDTTIRNANLSDLTKLLVNQKARQLDVVANATNMRAEDGKIVLYGTEAELTDDGVMPSEGTYRVTDVFDDGLSSKLDIPRAYLRRMHESRPDIWDATVNGWLHGLTVTQGVPDSRMARTTEIYPPDQRQFLVRLWRGTTDHSDGIARAFLSDRYGIMDNLDVLMASLDGIRAAGVTVEFPEGGVDLTERRMHVRITAPQIAAYAPDLLKDYRSPFDGHHVGGRWTPASVANASAAERQTMTNDGLVFAGFALRNSEVGLGRFTISPVIVFQVCGNGLTITADAMKATHLGGRLDEGVVKWTADTEQKALALIKAKARDAVSTFLDADYVKAKVAELTETAMVKITDAPKVVERVSKTMNYTEAEQASILEHFIMGGQVTAGGIMQAVTATAQTVTDPDEATRLEESALEAMLLASK